MLPDELLLRMLMGVRHLFSMHLSVHSLMHLPGVNVPKRDPGRGGPHRHLELVAVWISEFSRLRGQQVPGTAVAQQQ